MLTPKGILIAVGGAENRGEEKDTKGNGPDFYHEGILKTVAELACKHRNPRVEVVTTASSEGGEMAKMYRSAFRKLGCNYVGHLDITTREQAGRPELLERLQQATCVLFSGGDQLRLCSTLGGTAFLQHLMEKYQNEYFVIAGTSAGAAAMSSTIITGGDAADAYKKGTINLSIGFGFLPQVIIDTHFDERGRLGRLLQAIALQPGILALGLSEDTGVVVEKGTRLRAIGSGSVIIVDGSSVEVNNLSDIGECAPISISNLRLHALSHADTYDIGERKFIAVPTLLHKKE